MEKISTESSFKPSHQPELRDVSYDELLDDTIGLSLKSLQSISALIRRPIEYYSAAKTPFWENRFSPSFRIYAGLIAISTGMKFLYRDPESPMVTLYAGQFKTIIESGPADSPLTGVDPTLLAIATLKWYFIFSPFAMILLFTLLGFLYWGFGEKLSPVVRIRYVFATMIPASLVGILLIIPMFYGPDITKQFFSLTGMLFMLAACWITSYKGAFSTVQTKSGRVGRATAFSVLIMIVMFISAFIAMIAGSIFGVKEVLSALS